MNATRWTADQIPAQHGRTVIVTGANSGLGYVTARELARHGAHVIMGVRNPAAGQAAAARIRQDHPAAQLDVRQLDLADLTSVRGFAESIGEADVLVNNAGVMMCPKGETAQGFERQFGTNHLGHFALTGLLLGKLRPGRDPRVVTVSSDLHKRGRIDVGNLGGGSYSRVGAYCQSKLANVLFALELDRRLRAAGSPVRSLVTHPGYSDTNLQSSGPTGLMNLVLKVTNRYMAQPAEMGALTQLYAAAAPEAAGGQFIGPDGRGEKRGYPAIVHPAPLGTDAALARKLWTVSEEMTGVTYAALV
ncbi:oxidoreductase [Longispora albida]|uniref:oxidoreductase n=1 Tax=Longispora albida TaxID=203523 RepID=UPI00047662F9|nr:oxidoreductase [Longispora albida]